MKLKIVLFMLSVKKRFNVYICIILIIIGILFWILNFLTPEHIDDFIYKFCFFKTGNPPIDLNNPIDSVSEIFVSQYNHYFSFNGRSIVHIIAQLFSSFIGKSIFNIFNSIIFLLFIFLLTKLTSQVKISSILFTTAVVFLLIPSFKETFLWMTGSINYLWTLTLIMVFLFLLYHWKTKPFKFDLISPFLFVLGIVIGWTHEGISMPIAGALILILFTKNRSYWGSYSLPLIIGFIIGAGICSLGPATIKRADIKNINFLYLIFFKILSFLNVLSKLRAFWLLILSFILLFFYKRNYFKVWIKNFYNTCQLEFFSLFLSFIIVLISGFRDPRAAIGVEIFSIILILRIFSIVNFSKKKLFQNIVIIISIIVYSIVLKFSLENFKNYNYKIDQVINSNNEFILYNDNSSNSFINNYILIPYFHIFMNDASIWEYKILESYKPEGRKPFELIPENVYNSIKEKSVELNDISLQKEWKYYIIPIDFSKLSKTPVFLLGNLPEEKIPFYFRPFKSRLERYTLQDLDVIDFIFINLDCQLYCIINKDPVIDERVVGIEFR